MGCEVCEYRHLCEELDYPLDCEEQMECEHYSAFLEGLEEYFAYD